MEYFSVQGRNQWEAMENVRVQYGASARILSRKTIRYGGVLGIFRREGIEISGYLAAEPVARKAVKRPGVSAVSESAERGKANLEEEKKKILDGVRKEQTLKLILEEIKALKKGMGAPADESLHPTVARIKKLLELNEFTPAYIRKMLERVRSEFSLEDLAGFDQVRKAVVLWIAEGIEIYSPNGKSRQKPRIIIVIGPTGVGKTTTIAKLGAIFGLGGGESPALQVRMVTIDNYRIAARKQIETYAEIMQIPISFAESRTDLAKIIDLYQDVDMILIDTIGKSPTDFTKLGEMKSILSACGSMAEIHLAISATTKTSDATEILRHFEPFHYDSLIITKLDETNRVGNIISILSENGKRLSFITDGQQVPQDIEEASAKRLLDGLEGFRVERSEPDFEDSESEKWKGWSEP